MTTIIEEKKGEANDADSAKAFENIDDPHVDISMTPSEEKQHVEEEIIAQSMTLDVAYKSLETIRQVNLQVEFGRDLEETECVSCLREARDRPVIAKSRFRTWVSEKTASKAAACLPCGSHVCKNHRSSSFSKQNITVCLDCAHLFSLDYMMQNIVHADNDAADMRKKEMNNMLEVYDRALLILTYSIQFLEEVVVALEENTSRHNKVGLGSSATGVVSGGLGVVAAATIFTPVGPPLLLASILFGGGAAAADAASEAVNYRCEPNKMADRIITLHSIINCIARLPAMVDMEVEEESDSSQKRVENQSALHWRRTAMNSLKPLTAGALSAVSIVTEAREMKTIVDKIRAGNPCEKAEELKSIKIGAPMLPQTDHLSNQLNDAIKRQQELAKTSENSPLPALEEAVASS